MNEKIKKTFRAITSAVLAGAFVVSSVIGGGADSFVSSSVVFAEDIEKLEDGDYIVPINPIAWKTEKVQTSKSIPYSPHCLLNVENNVYTVTMKLNADFYAGWILDNKLNASYSLPKNIWSSLGADEETEFNNLTNNTDGSYTSNRYTFSESNNDKFNSVQIQKKSEDDTYCYVTFELSDYSEKFYSIFWSANKSSSGVNDKVQALKLDISSAYSVSELKDCISENRCSIAIEEARKVLTTNGNALNEDQELKALFQSSVDTVENDGMFTARFELKNTQLGNSDIIAINAFTSKTYVENSTYNNSLPYNATYGKQLLNVNSLGVQAEYTEDDLIYGLEITVETEETKTSRESATNLESGTIDMYTGYFGTLYLTPIAITDVSIADSNQTGVYVTGTSDILPQTAILTVIKDRPYTEYPDTSPYTRDGIIEWQGTMYNDPKHWFYIELTDENGNDLLSYNGITLHIPLDIVDESNDPTKYAIFAFNKNDGLFFSTDNHGNERYGSVKQITDGSGNTSFEFQYLNSLGDINIQQATFAYMQPGNYADIHGLVKSGDDDGIYKGTAQLQKYGTRGSSMANAALNPDVMITIHDGEAKLYYTADYLTVLTQKAYIGELLPYDVSKSGTWFEESSIYTNFLTDENGALVSNCGYDPITEAGCVKGGIITLREETYDATKECYNLAIVPPAMLGGEEYSTIDKTELTVHLRVTDFQKVADYSEQNVLEYVKAKYPYDKSALLRKIRQAEIKYNIGKNTASDSTAFTEAYKVYSDPDAKSQDIEAAIKALDAVTTDVAPSAVIKGHDLTVNQWYELSYYVDLGYDVQSDKNAKVVFTLADGRTKTFDVTDDLFVAGQGYRFTLELAAKQMADKIHAKVVFSDGTEKDFSDEYSVKEFLNDYISTGEDENLKAFAQATLNYGAYAQKFFDYNTEDLAAELADVSGITAEQIADPANAIPKNVGDEIEFAGAALTLEGETSIKLYFNLTGEFPDPDDHTIMYNNKKLKMQASNVSGVWYVTIPGIKAKQLGNVFKFTVDGTEYEYSPYTYMNKVLTNWEDTKYPYLHELLKALYAYSIAANNC